MEITNEQMLELYRWLVMERLFDEKIEILFRMGKIMSMFHSVLGQEAAFVGAYYALQEGDAFCPRSRGKVVYLMRGMNLRYFVAGLLGKNEGLGQGRTPAGSHMNGDISLGLLPTSGSVGTSVNTGVGAALAMKLKGEPKATLIINGDGGSNRGDIHEGMNFAAVLGLPAVFYFINNGWAISVRADDALSVERISERAAGYGIPGVTIDGRDVLKVYKTISEALNRARQGEGPMLVEAMVDRWSPHSANDPEIYRTDEERAEARKIDPIREYEIILEELGMLDKEKEQEIRREITTELDTAIDYAESGTEPDFNSMTYGVYKERT
jgi:2-oxoisovalerate dehydrogenase E1 component alpha subunit